MREQAKCPTCGVTDPYRRMWTYARVVPLSDEHGERVSERIEIELCGDAFHSADTAPTLAAALSDARETVLQFVGAREPQYENLFALLTRIDAALSPRGGGSDG